MNKNKYKGVSLLAEPCMGSQCESPVLPVLVDTQVVDDKDVNTRTVTVLANDTTHSTKKTEKIGIGNRDAGPTAGPQPCEKCSILFPGSDQLHWQDCYGNWHCSYCAYPQAETMVRGKKWIGPKKSELEIEEEKTDPFNFHAEAGIKILAARFSDGEIIFNSTLGPTEKRRAVDVLDFAGA